MPLVSDGFIRLQEPLGLVFTPTHDALCVALLFGLAGMALLHRRVRTKEPGRT